MDIAAIAALAPVVPVLTIERATDAVPLARALMKGGLPVLEITLRTGAALEALKAVAAEVPEAVIDAGTVLESAQFDRIRQAGARFAVSPGCTPTLVTAARAAGLPFLPAIQTGKFGLRGLATPVFTFRAALLPVNTCEEECLCLTAIS